MSEYTTIEGTDPRALVKHDPRTVTRKDGDDLRMMTEIGDGVFVEWENCRRCSQRIAGCTCPNGPVEATFMAKWRNERFDRELNERPEPSYTVLPKVIAMLEERGYTVTPPGATEEDAAVNK